MHCNNPLIDFANLFKLCIEVCILPHRNVFCLNGEKRSGIFLISSMTSLYTTSGPSPGSKIHIVSVTFVRYSKLGGVTDCPTDVGAEEPMRQKGVYNVPNNYSPRNAIISRLAAPVLVIFDSDSLRCWYDEKNPANQFSVIVFRLFIWLNDSWEDHHLHLVH